LYVPFFSDDFKKHLEKLTRRDNVLNKRIINQIEDMKNDPYRNSIELSYELKGKRRVKVGDYRLIYAVCSDCRKKGYVKFNQCYDCKSKDDNTIIFFDVFHRSKGYDFL
jgi:mRNA-degrading endonuclease RelE of RelBE toxin-antitoxin system